MATLNAPRVLALMFVLFGIAEPVRAQTGAGRPIDDQPVPPRATPSAALGFSFVPVRDFGLEVPEPSDLEQVIQQPAGPPPTPRHTGIKALVKGMVVNFKYLPSRENLLWAGLGGASALAVHPLDDNLNRSLVGNDTADKVFKAGEVLGELPTLLASASVVYAVGRIGDKPRVSHVGMDLIQALGMSEVVTQTLKYTTRRERPDHSGRNSFPSGHAADTFAFATALERHLGWRYAGPAYAFASYVAISRLPANRHWFSDAVFGAAVGVIAGRTVTSHEAHPFPVTVNYVPGGGVSVMYVRRQPQ